MKVLVGCEFSGVVRDAFIRCGHDAVSCDFLPTESPGPHIEGDVVEVLEEGWDMLLAFPPCTYLCSSGLHWNARRPGREARTHEAMLFVLKLMGEGFAAHGIPKVGLENPVGRINTAYRKPDQTIHPWQFGHDASKATCLWLRGLPLLTPTRVVEAHFGCSCGTRFAAELGRYGCPDCHGAGKVRSIWANQTPTGQNRLGPSERRWMERSRTYEGIAQAMADQWGACVRNRRGDAMKVYQGTRGGDGCEVVVKQDGYPDVMLRRRLDLRNHSPTGFEWGYAGSGPAQLALALCADVLDDDARALRVYQHFKGRQVQGWKKDAWQIDEEAVKREVRAIERAYPKEVER